MKIYIEDNKYNNNNNNFNYKLLIFYNYYKRADILDNIKVKAYLIIL